MVGGTMSEGSVDYQAWEMVLNSILGKKINGDFGENGPKRVEILEAGGRYDGKG